jgi:hypothetical protein
MLNCYDVKGGLIVNKVDPVQGVSPEHHIRAEYNKKKFTKGGNGGGCVGDPLRGYWQKGYK